MPRGRQYVVAAAAQMRQCGSADFRISADEK
jgi:hypothetical protein